MSSIKSANTLPPDQIAPREVVARFVTFKNTILASWKIVASFVVLGGIIGFIIDATSDHKPRYTALITFNLGGGSSGGGMGNLGDLAGMFGLSAGAPDANIFMGENFLYYAKSRPIIEQALLKEVPVPPKQQKVLLANYYIEKSGIRDEEWEKNDTLRSLRFVNRTASTFTRLENMAMADIFTRIKGETTVFQPDRKSSFMALKTGMLSESLAKLWAETLLETIQEDYTQKQTRKTLQMKKLLESRADSLYTLMTTTEGRLARYINQNQQVIVAEGQLQQNKLARNSTFLEQLYYQAIQSVENIRLSLIKEAPLFTIIEPVSMPLYKETKEPIAMQAGLVLGFILSLVIIFLRQAYRSIMQA